MSNYCCNHGGGSNITPTAFGRHGSRPSSASKASNRLPAGALTMQEMIAELRGLFPIDTRNRVLTEAKFNSFAHEVNVVPSKGEPVVQDQILASYVLGRIRQ